MEKCDRCGVEFSVVHKRKQRDLDEVKKKTGMICCDRCRKRYHEAMAVKAFRDDMNQTPKGRQFNAMMDIISSNTRGFYR